MIRKFVLRDYDFYNTNVGILAGDRTRLINFDYEYVLREDVSYYRNELDDTFSYCKTVFPDSGCVYGK